MAQRCILISVVVENVQFQWGASGTSPDASSEPSTLFNATRQTAVNAVKKYHGTWHMAIWWQIWWSWITASFAISDTGDWSWKSSACRCSLWQPPNPGATCCPRFLMVVLNSSTENDARSCESCSIAGGVIGAFLSGCFASSCCPSGNYFIPSCFLVL